MSSSECEEGFKTGLSLFIEPKDKSKDFSGKGISKDSEKSKSKDSKKGTSKDSERRRARTQRRRRARIQKML